jgi:membrane fusion protein, multidrug efflux system
MKVFIALMVWATAAQAEDTAVPPPQPRPVVSERVNLQAGAAQSYVGTVVPMIEIDLGFPFIGTVAERPVENGDLVRQGALLARLNPADMDADLRAAEAGVTVTTAQLRSAKDAETRAIALRSRGVGSETRVEDAKRALAAAQARSVQAAAALARAQDIRNLADLKAPQDGIVTQVFAESGATLPAGQPIVRLAATNSREVVIDLSETDVAALDVGARFHAVLAANAAITTDATLTRIDPVADRSTRTRRLHLTLGTPPEGFRLGALVRVSAALGPDAGVAITADAVVHQDGAAAVWVVDRATNKVALTPVQLGERFGSQVRVKTGLAAGDEVIIKGVHSLTEGQSVGPGVAP